MAPEIPSILVDADACPVKDEVVRVAARHGFDVVFVSNAWMRLPEGPRIRRVVVPEGPDIADDWIASHANASSIVITADIPLAARALKAGAQAIDPKGKPFTEASIGYVLATRNLMAHLRETGVVSTYNRGFEKQDRSRFLQALEHAAQIVKRR